VAAAYLNWLKYPLSESIQGLELGFKHAVAGGNPAFGTGCAYNLVGSLWYSVPLPQIVSCSGAFSLFPRVSCRAWYVRHILIFFSFLFFSLDPYRRYSEETGWTDVCKMLITFERFAKLLMGTAVDESDEEFEVYIETDARPMPIGAYATERLSLSLAPSNPVVRSSVCDDDLSATPHRENALPVHNGSVP
jgi:hypothetical protein